MDFKSEMQELSKAEACKAAQDFFNNHAKDRIIKKAHCGHTRESILVSDENRKVPNLYLLESDLFLKHLKELTGMEIQIEKKRVMGILCRASITFDWSDD